LLATFVTRYHGASRHVDAHDVGVAGGAIVVSRRRRPRPRPRGAATVTTPFMPMSSYGRQKIEVRARRIGRLRAQARGDGVVVGGDVSPAHRRAGRDCEVFSVSAKSRSTAIASRTSISNVLAPTAGGPDRLRRFLGELSMKSSRARVRP
jgi:hypothetical protein